MVGAPGGAHFEFTRINTTPTFLPKKIEDVHEASASMCFVAYPFNVRGICALRPGIPGVSANIEVVSIVDRFSRALAHLLLSERRRRGGVSGEHRLDVTQPRQVHRADVPGRGGGRHAKVLYALRAMFRDNARARWLGSDGVYRRRPAAPGERPFRVQQHLQTDASRRPCSRAIALAWSFGRRSGADPHASGRVLSESSEVEERERRRSVLPKRLP
jgi:polyphosphate kinase-like protein